MIFFRLDDAQFTKRAPSIERYVASFDKWRPLSLTIFFLLRIESAKEKATLIIKLHYSTEKKVLRAELKCQSVTRVSYYTSVIDFDIL